MPGGIGALRLAVHPDDLLPGGSGPPSAAENPRLDRSGSGWDRNDAVGRDAALDQRAPDRLAGRILPDHPQRQHLRAQGVEVVAGVRGPPEPDLLREVPQDQHRSFTRDALGLAEHVLVRDEVAHDEDPPAREPLDDPEEVGGLSYPRHGRREHREGSAHGDAHFRRCHSSAPLY